MKKTAVILLILSIFCLTAACGGEKEETKDSNIEIINSETGETQSTLTSDREINRFVEALKIGDWTMESLPGDLQEEKEFNLNINETIKLGHDAGDVSINTGAVLTTYQNSEYVTLDLKGFDLNFKVPADVAEYLHSL